MSSMSTNPKISSLPWLWLTAWTLAVSSLGGCNDPSNNTLQQIRANGEIRVLTRNSPSTYYEAPDGFAGFEYDIITAFANNLGVEAKFIVADSFSDIIPLLSQGKADIAAAGLAITKERKKQVSFGPPYQNVRQQLIYRFGTRRPKNLRDLKGKYIEIPDGNRAQDTLTRLQVKYPKLQWSINPDKDAEELLEMVWEGLLDYTITDSHIYDLERRHYPELRSAFRIGKTEHLAWAFPKSGDPSLFYAAVKFIKKFRRSGELKRLIDRYYGAASVSNPVNMTVFRLRLENRLPLYQLLYEKAGKKHDVDWRLLAAIGYQESYWDPEATSPTGVRGIMQLTLPTAKQMGVSNRLDPAQAIEGGAKYIRRLIKRIPKDVTGPDRVWLALASYNVGFGHVIDARQITRQQGGNPSKWDDVKQRLLLLTRSAWYKKTKHGYARGNEAVTYVTRIRNYYRALVKYDDALKEGSTTEAFKLKVPAI